MAYTSYTLPLTNVTTFGDSFFDLIVRESIIPLKKTSGSSGALLNRYLESVNYPGRGVYLTLASNDMLITLGGVNCSLLAGSGRTVEVGIDVSERYTRVTIYVPYSGLRANIAIVAISGGEFQTLTNVTSKTQAYLGFGAVLPVNAVAIFPTAVTGKLLVAKAITAGGVEVHNMLAYSSETPLYYGDFLKIDNTQYVVVNNGLLLLGE